jgi:hypothetical protein
MITLRHFSPCKPPFGFPLSPMVFLKAFILSAAVSGVATTARAQSVTFSAASPTNHLAASVTFADIGRDELKVTLINTYTGDTLDQAHILTGVFFSGATGLTPVSATAGSGSLEWAGKHSAAPESSSILGTEWAYASGSGAPAGAASGIVSAGYWVPGHGNFASPGDMLDGSAYGIISAGYAGSDKDGLGNRQYIQDSMVFVLSGFSGNVDNISDITFQYGTGLTDPNLPVLSTIPMPEPTTLALVPVMATVWWLKIRFWRLKKTARRETMD